MPKLGQHFLHNQSVVNKIINELAVTKGEVVIEIGPGEGALTLPLLSACEKKGALLIAVERDNELADAFSLAHPEDKVEIIRGDVLKALPAIVSRPGFAPVGYKIVGNIPYYITGHLLRVVGELERKPSRVVIMIQREVAKRLTAKPPEMNLLAAATQFWADTRLIANLKPGDFTPPPKVHSAVVGLSVRPTAREVSGEDYYRTIKVLFKQPRKTILNNIAEAIPKEKRSMTAPFLDGIMIKSGSRPQDLSISDILRLASKLPALLA